jgi:hypothetical protein
MVLNLGVIFAAIPEFVTKPIYNLKIAFVTVEPAGIELTSNCTRALYTEFPEKPIKYLPIHRFLSLPVFVVGYPDSNEASFADGCITIVGIITLPY